MKSRWFAVLALVACSPQPQKTPEPGAPTLEQIAAGQRTVVDLTWPINADNPHWPGEGYAPFSFETIATLAEDGVFSGAFQTPEHLGTHLDAPNHFEEGRSSVDAIPLTRLLRPLAVVDVRERCAADADYLVSTADIRAWESDHGGLPEGAVVAALTGWSERWSDYDAYKNADEQGRLHFPGFAPETARFLASERAVAGLVIDTLSVDYGLSETFEVHHVSGSAEVYHIENAARLDEVPPSGAWLLIAPIKIEGGSGGQARVWAIF